MKPLIEPEITNYLPFDKDGVCLAIEQKEN